jgi:hypothetical protein
MAVRYLDFGTPLRIDVRVPSRDSHGSHSITARIVPGDRIWKKLTIVGIPRLRLIDSHSTMTLNLKENNHDNES